MIARIAESKIRAALDAGEFDDLPGRGKPLAPDELSRVPAELRMGLKLLRNSGCLPPELEARKEVARLDDLLASTGDPEERAVIGRRRAVAELRYRLLLERRKR